MTVKRGFLITLASGFMGSLLGALIGVALGRLAPDYYRLVFQIPAGMSFDPVQVGVGLGITQGLAVGLFVGLVIVVFVGWYELHARRESDVAAKIPQTNF